MLQRVEARSPRGSLITLNLQQVVEGIFVTEIEGLDPVKANITSTSFAQSDGTQYQNSKREARNIVMKVELKKGAETVKELRSRLYNVFMPKSVVSLRFVDSSGESVDVEGRVEDFTSPLFTDKPVAYISVVCDNPDFYNPVPVLIPGMTTAVGVLTDIPYIGTTDTGLIFRLSVSRPLSGFSIIHLPPDNSTRVLEFAGALLAGDLVEISTVQRRKYVNLTRDGVTASILYAMSPYSDWTTLQPGLNRLRVYAPGAGVPYTIEYAEKFGGL